MIWKDVAGYEGLYLVSDQGDLFSIRSGRVLKPNISKDGYWKVVLSDHGKRQTLRVHRLIAEAFVPNPQRKSVVNHKDGNKLNNRADNLEWVTVLENTIHAVETGLLKGLPGESNPMSKLTLDQVEEIRRTYRKGSHDANARILAERFGVSDSTIWLIASGKIW